MDIGDPPELDPTFARLRITSAEQFLDLVGDPHRNPFLDFFLDCLPPLIKTVSPTLIGISVNYEWQLIPALTIVAISRGIGTRIPTFIGGPYITYARSRLLHHPEIIAAADGYVVFDGELATVEFLREPHRVNRRRVPNLIYAVGKKIKHTEPAPPLPAETAPAPLFAPSALALCLLPEPVLPILANRSACPYGRCAFCNTSHSFVIKDNRKSVERLFDEIEELHRHYGCRHFTFNDDCVPLETITRLCNILLAEKKSYRFFAALRSSETIKEEDLQLMKRAGFVRLQFGFESAVDRMLNRFAKNRSHGDMLRILNLCSRAEISVLLSAFVGFPGERKAEAEATIDFFNRENRLFDAVSLVPYSFEEGSIAWDHPERYGITVVTDSKHDLFNDRAYTTKSGISREAVLQLLAERPVWSRFEPVLGTAASLLYLSKYGYSSFTDMIRRVRKEGSPLHPRWR